MARRFESVGFRIFAAPSDFSAAADFYGSVPDLECGFRLDALAIFELGSGASLILEAFDPDADLNEEESLLARFTGFTLQVPDVAASYAELTGGGVAFLGPPERMPWGGTLAHFADPAGNVLSLVEQPSP
jgi:predicted enzyme related to lactoylglutathione lyase